MWFMDTLYHLYTWIGNNVGLVCLSACIPSIEMTIPLWTTEVSTVLLSVFYFSKRSFEPLCITETQLR